MSLKLFKMFCRKNGFSTTATTEETTMNAMHKAPESMHHDGMGARAQARAAGRRPAVRNAWAKAAAVALGAAGRLLGSGRGSDRNGGNGGRNARVRAGIGRAWGRWAAGVAIVAGALLCGGREAWAADFYWKGGSGSSDNIDQNDNWWSNSHPSSGDNLYFNNTSSRHWPYCNYGSGAWFNYLIVYSGAGEIKWRGDTTYAYKFENNNSGDLVTFEANIANRGNSNWELNPVGSGGIKVEGNITSQDGKTLNIYGDNQLEVTGTITGTGPIKVKAGATVILAGNNSGFTGALSLDAAGGTLLLKHNNAAGTAAGGVTVASGARVQLQGGITTPAETLNLYGTGVSTSGALQNLSGNNTWGGTVLVKASDTRIHSDSGSLTIAVAKATSSEPYVVKAADGASVTISDFQSGQSKITKEGDGVLRIVNNSGGYLIGINVSDGILEVAHSTTWASSLNITNTASGTAIRLDGATTVNRFYTSSGVDTVLELDATSASACETLTSGLWSINGATTIKLSPSYAFDPTANATWTILDSANTTYFTENERNRISMDYSGFGDVGGTFSTTWTTGSNSKSNGKLTVTYTAPVSAPELSSPTATVTGTTTATLGATVDKNNGLSITDYGIVYSSTASTPTVGGSGCTKAQKGTSTPTSGAAWTVNVTGLSAGTTYYYRGYATSSAGTGYTAVGTFTTLANQAAVTLGTTEFTYAGSTIQLSGSGGSGSGAYTFAYGANGTGAGSVTSAGVLTVTKAGTMTIQVTRAASGSYAARTDTVTITVEKGTQTISGLSDVTKTYGNAAFSLSASAAGAVTYSISPSSVATVSGSTVTIAGAGTATITANAAATDLYNAASATATLTVNKAAQTLTVSPTSMKLYVNGGKGTITATAGHGSPTISYAVTAGGSNASVTGGGEVSPVAAGSATITVTAGETANYGSATATCSVKVHAAVPSAPTGMGVTARAANSLTVGWTRGTGGTASMGVASLSSTFTAPNDSAPSSGSGSYTANATYGSGTALGSGYVVYLSTGASPSVPVTGLTPATRYYFAAYSRAGGSALYAFSSAATADAWTLATEPTGQAGSLTAGTVGSRKASVTWTAGAYTAASGESSSMKTLLVVVPSGSSVTAPTDGVTHSAGDALGAGTVAFAGTGTSAEITGLTPEQTYTVYAYAYTEGDDGTTANYLTTSPATRSITTIASQGPNVWATGVDGTSYLLNWSALASDSAGYDVQTRTSGGSWADGGTLLRNSFTSAEGWTAQNTSSTITPNANDGTWEFKGSNSSYPVKIQPTDTSVNDEAGDVVLAVENNYLMTPPVSGSVTSVRVKWRAFTSGARSLKLYTETGTTYGTETLRTTWSASAGEYREDVYTFSTALTGGVRFKLVNGGGGSLWVGEIAVCSSMPGYSQQVTGLTSGSTYEARVRKTPDGDWSDELSVKAGVVPNTPTASAVRNAVTFTWTDAQSGAAGYMVDATTTDQAWANKTCPSASLTLNSFGSGQDWKYTGTPATSTSGSVNSAPTYSTAGSEGGHYLVGQPGNGIESKPFAIAGATGLKLTFRVRAWNLANSSQKLETGRVNAYYKLDSGPWCFLGTATPSATDDNSSSSCSFALPAGALDGNEIAFKVVAPNATGHNESYLRGVYIAGLAVSSTSLGAGYYGANSLSGYPRLATSAEASAKSVKASGLTAGQSVGFRVQALQGSAANPTAKSVWVEATGTATAYTAPGTPVLGDVTRNGMTATWTAGDTTDLDHYVVQWSTSSTFASGVSSANVAAGTLTKAITGLAADTTYYVRVKAVGTDGEESDWSAAASAKTSAFSGPATVSASGETRNGMTLAWDAVSGAASYNVEWTTCAVAAEETTVGTQCPSSTRPYDTHSATDWTYRKGYSSSAGYAAGAYPYWHSSFGHWLAGQYVNTTYKPGVETPDVDLSDAASASIVFAHRKANDGTNTLATFSPVTLYYSLDGGTTWTAGGTSSAGTASWVTKSISLPAAVLGRKDVRLQLRADKAAAYYDTSVSAYKPAGAGIKDIVVKKVPTGGNYECAATESRTGVAGTTLALTGLSAETLYYFRVQAVGSGDGATSGWTAGSAATTPFAGPAVAVTGNTRYTLTAGWPAYSESGYTVSYDVQVTGCGNAESMTESCPAQNLDWGSSASAWTYQRAYSGSTASSYPKYDSGVHKLWGQYSSTSVEPGILSPELDLAGYASASVEFSHMYVNRANMSGVTLEYSLDEGANWTVVASTGTAAGYTLATASSRTIALPSEALAGGVKLRLRTTHATNYEVDGSYMAQGASIANLRVVAVGTGGGDYETSGCASTVYNTTDTSHTFTGLNAGANYYVRVRTVLTPTGGGAVEMSSWREASGSTAAPQDPPAEVWAENVRQNHMTVAWSEVDGATASTLYELQATGCAAGSASVTAVQPSSTEADLGEGDDWAYIGGGTEVTDAQSATITGRGTYPAYAASPESSQVLAGEGEPGLESVSFSTLGATAGTVAFYHGRWYNSGDLSSGPVTVSYSTDGGASWTDIDTTAYSDLTEYATVARSIALPAAALGHANVKVRLEARSATVNGSGVPVGCAIRSAKVTLTKATGNYDSCSYLRTFSGLTAETLSQTLEGLTAGQPYYFRVRASDGLTTPAQYGAWVEGTAATVAAPAVPGTPWAVDVGRHAMTIRWQPVDGAETYTVVVYKNGTEVKTQSGVANTEWMVTGLDGSTTYTFKVSAQADGESSALSAEGTATTTAQLRVTGLRAEDILDTSMTLKWDQVSGVTYTLHWGEASAEGTTTLNQEVACPASTLKRSDAGNKWFYFGGNASWPAYWTTTVAADQATDHGHALIYNAAGQPGIQSRWFSTFDASAAYVEFLHGRFNSGADSTVLVEYSIDGGATWATAGTAPSTGDSVTMPTVQRSIPLPAAALGRRSVMVRLTATGASGNKGAHVRDLKVRVVTSEKNAGSYTTVNNSQLGSTGSYALSGLTAGKRYWFELYAQEGSSSAADDNAEAETTAATRTKTVGAVLSQGFEGLTDATRGALDTAAWGYTVKYMAVDGSAVRTEAQRLSTDPKVEVVADENPLYGDRALRMSGSAAASVYGVAEFADYNPGGANSWVVTIPFAARDLASGENLWVSYSTDGGSTWAAPSGLATITKAGMTLGKIARGGDDAANQNWPYNKGLNSTTRPAGDAYSFEVSNAARLAVRIAFCGNSGSAAHYVYIDGVTLTRKPGMPTPVSATAQDSGGVLLTWTAPEGQGVVILRGQDERHVPASPVDVENIPHGYAIVMNGDSPYWPNDVGSFTDMAVQSGWTYYYYFYGAVAEGGTYTLGTTPNTASALVKGMVQAIASQGWDDFDIHPWGYRLGRVTNPGRSSDYGFWKEKGMNATTVAFIENSYETDATHPTTVGPAGERYATYYGTGDGAGDADKAKQLGVSSQTNYYGGHSFRLSGGGSATYSGTHVWTDYDGNVKTNSNPAINTNNAAIEFANVDLSGYKNVEFTMHFAGMNLNGGNDLHVAISTNGGAAGSWLEVANNNEAGWRVYESHYDYGRAISDGDTRLGGNWNFYFEDSARATPYGNPYVLQVPDTVTQFMVRVMFYDSNGGSRRNASYFIDEVRLTGEVAIEAPHPVLTDISKTELTASWEAVPDATGYNVKLTACEKSGAVQLQEGFVLNVLDNGWTGEGEYELTSAANRRGSGYGVSLNAKDEAAISPMVGAASSVSFWLSSSSANSGAKMEVQARAEGETTWVTVAEYTAPGTTWAQKTVQLPRRQWQQVRFVKTVSPSTVAFRIDDVVISGGGNYESCSAKLVSATTTATNYTFTGLSEGTEYFVEVQAYGSPAGYLAYSAWAETADYTPGTFAVAADGFEMTRSTWGASASVPILVMAVNEGKAFSEATVPTGDPAVGTAFGEGVVIAKGTSAQSAPGFEHVVPYGSRTEPLEAKYVAYWKHGNYWEGRLETNVVLGTYVCAAADAIAVTNGTAVASGSQGKGWDGSWQAWEDGASYVSVIEGSLVGSNKLAGAGGNMVRFTMEDTSRYLRLYRPLATAMSSGEVWIMATFRSRYGMDPSNPNESKTLAVQLSDAKDNPAGGVYAGDSPHVFAQFGRLADTDRHMKIWDSSGNTASSYTLDDWGHGSGSGIYTMVAKYTRGDGNLRVKVYYDGGTGTISGGDGQLRPTATEPQNSAFDAVRNVGTHNVASIFLMASGYHGYADFDEIRVGESWQDIVGKETEAPFPVTSAEAWTDGNELVRVSWTYAAAGMDGTIERPLADGVRVYQSEDAGTTWTQIYQGKGTNEAAVAAGGISRWDHVVAPGSTHRYKVEAYAAGKTAAAVNAALKGSSPATYDVTTGTYGATEYVNPFSYTNWSVASTASGLQWLGGNGFGENYWAPGSGSAGTWSIATPEEAQAAVHITNVVTGARLAAGNVLKVVVGDGETASMSRQLAGDAWCGSAGQTFYVAFRMAYQWGDQGGRQVGLRLTDDGGKYVQFGKARGDDSGYQHRFGVTASPNGTGYTSGWSTGGDDMPGYGTASDAAKAYLVVGKVNWSASGKANLRAVHYGIGTNGTPATLPSEESSVTWEASYDNAGIGAIRKIELIAGTENSGYGTIGTAWFDEIRFGTSWEDIVGATEPEDVWVDGIGVETADTVTRYLGDYATWYMHGWPKGAKQSAWVSLATSSAFTTILATNDTSWVENTSDNRGGEQTKWLGGEIQFTQTGTLYGGGSVKGELVTMNSWNRADHGIDSYKWNAYTVNPLTAPAAEAAGGTAKVTLSWTPYTDAASRTFSEVMVVRYTGSAPSPVQGQTYLKGETIGTGTVVYRGSAATSLVDKGLTKNTTYYYAFYTVNNSYYSPAATASATTDANDPPIVIDGDPIEWVGVPSEVKNSSTLSSGEWIWTDKVLDGRVDKNGAYDADITEFRMKVDNNGYVNFMVRLHCLTNRQNPYISVGIVTNVDATRLAAAGNEDGENWIGDESATFMGGNLFDPASLHYADIQMAVHWVTTAGENGAATGSGGWVVELYRKDGNSWFAPAQAWEAASSANLAEDPCIEWKVKRSDLGLDYPNVTPARFTVASFVNGGGWNNDTEATVDLSSGTSHAVDTLCIAPWGVNDKDLSLSAWDEGIKDANAEYWFDIWFGPTALHNASPNAPASYTLNGAAAENGQKVAASPVMSWAQCADGPSGSSAYRGFVVGYLVEVSTNEYFNGLEGTTENGPISCRVNVKGADTTSYRYKTDSRYYWWRVRARDNSGALSAPTPWRYEVEGKTDNEGPEARLLFVGPDADVARYVSDAAYRREQDLSGDATSVLDSDLEAGGQRFGFVIEWYDVNGVFATNWLRAWKEGDGANVWPSSASNPYGSWTGNSPSVGDFAWNILAEHEDGTPFGRVSPNWDLIIVDRSTVGKDSPTVASETVSGTSYNYVMKEDLVLPTDDGGTETLEKVWIIDCGLDKVFQPTETINDGNKGQYVTNHVTGAFAIETYRTDLEIYLTVSAEDSCTTGPYVETADYDWPLYDTSTPPDTGSYKAQGSASGTLSGFCAAAPNPSRNVTTNQLLHIHVRDNDTMPPVTSQAKWRADATGEGGTVLLPMMAVTSGGDANAPANWDPTWANLGAQGRVPTQEGQGKALQWQLTDGDVATYTHPATAGGTGTTSWKGSAAPIRLFFNVYDEYLNSGLASFKTYDAGTPWNASTWTAQDGMEGAYTSVADNQRTLRNTGLVMPGTAGTPTTNWTGYAAAWSKITAYEWTEAGNNEHGLGTGPDSVLAWQLDATQANLEGLLGQDELLSNARIGIVNGEQQIVANAVRLHAIDNDNNAVGDQEGADLEFGQLIFTDDDATPPEMASFTLAGTGTNFTHFGRLGQWTWGTGATPVPTATPLMGALTLSADAALKARDTSPDPERHWNTSGSAYTIYYRGYGCNNTVWNATGVPYFEFSLTGDGNTTWSADMIGFENRVAKAGPTMYTLTVQAEGGTYSEMPALTYTGSGSTTDNVALAGDTIGTYFALANAEAGTVGSGAKKTACVKLANPAGTSSASGRALSPSGLSSYTVSFKAGCIGTRDGNCTLTVKYLKEGDASPVTVATIANSSSVFTNTAASGTWVAYEYDLIEKYPDLKTLANTVQIILEATGVNGSKGFALADLLVSTATGDSAERVLGTMEIDKDWKDDGSEFAEETVTSVVFGFDQPLQSRTADTHTFRLYAYQATRVDDSGEEVPSSYQHTWGIKNLFVHGTATEPKHNEVTDYDVAEGAWTNRLEALDGAMAGYDTARSGLRVKDAAGEVSGEKPSFRILYPEAYSTSPKGEASRGDLLLQSVSEATFDNVTDADFTAGSAAWTLDTGASVGGGRLTLESKAAAGAEQTVTLADMAGVQSVTVAGTLRAKGALTAANGGTNTLTVTATVYSKAGVELTALATNITANAAWKNYAVGPWALAYDNVGSVKFRVAQTDGHSTELLVDELNAYAAQWGADIAEGDAEWATTVVNGMPAAKMLVRTPELDLTHTAMPLSSNMTGTTAQKLYTLEATIHDYDGDRAGDALATTAATNFWLWDDDDMAPQWGAKFDSPMGIFMGGTVISLKARRNSGADQIWPILDSDLTALAPDAEVLFSLSAYDYSGWKTTAFAVGSETVQSGDSVASAAATAGWSQTAAEGAPESPAATNTWSITAKNLYTAHQADFKESAGVTAELTANTTDLDNDRKDDSLATGNSRVGYAWFADQDVSAPGWGSQTTPYYGLMISTGVGASAGLADLIGTAEAPAPYALGGAANNQGEFAGRSYTVYDGQLKDAGANGANQFVITANLNDPLPTDAGARARRPTGLKRGSTLTESAAMWGDSSVAANIFTVTNTHLVLQTPWTGGAGSLTNVAFSEAFTDPAIGKTRINTQAGHTSWTWNFPTNDIGKLLPPSETVAALTLKVQAYDADANRHEDQMHAELVGPVITLRDDDTQAPTAPTAVKVNGEAVVAGSITRETAPWTNDLSQIQVSWTAATDPEPTGYDIKKAGIAGYRLASHDATIDPDAGSALAGTTTNGTTVSKALSGVTMDQGWDTYKLFAVDADADRPGDALAGTAADVPLAYDITLPTAVAPNGSATGSGNRLVADPDNTDDPTTQFDLTWPIDGIGPDDPSDTDHYNAIPAKYKAAGVKVSDQEILSPWMTYKVYYTTFEESDVSPTDNPNSQENSWVYQQHIRTGAYKSWPSVVATSTATDPTAAANPYGSLAAVTANAGNGKQTVRLYDLDFDQHYMVIVVGVDKAGNEGPAGMWSWATNNTIKFAVTQGVVKATAAINAEVGDLVSGQATNTVGMAKIAGDNAPAKAAALYWMAAGMKNGAGKVSKYYDLIYRDAPSFSEKGTEQWNMASTADNSGTSKTNWNYQADAGLSTPGRLRFYRASYTGRWQDTKPGTSEKQYPLASEEVYSMNNVVLSEGFNYVSLQGVPWTNTFRGVFGTDTDMWPGGTTAADAAVVEFYTPGSRGNIAVESYFFGTDGKWYSSAGTTDVTDTLQADGFFARPFSINLPALATNEEGEVTGWWAEHDDSAVTARYNSRRLKGMMWHPILQVPTNAPTADGYTQTISGAAGTYNTLSLNLPVAVHPSQLGLGGIKKSNQPWLADKLYVVDTATKEVRGNTTMYCDANGVWRYNSNRAEVTGTPIRPNDMIVLISAGGDDENDATVDWDWTYSPADFYDKPTRHMGREHLQEP